MTTNAARSSVLADESVEPIVCDLSAIPPEERARHIDLARELLFADEGAIREIENGLTVELAPERLVDAARFVDNERRCCRHLAFALDVPMRGGNLTLRVTGQGAREELQMLVRLMRRAWPIHDDANAGEAHETAYDVGAIGPVAVNPPAP